MNRRKQAWMVAMSLKLTFKKPKNITIKIYSKIRCFYEVRTVMDIVLFTYYSVTN